MGATQSTAVAGFTVWAATYEQTVADEVLKYMGMPYEELLGRIAGAAHAGPDEHVLDIGTGTGTLALAIAGQMTTGHVWGIDPTLAMLERAQANAKHVGLSEKVDFRQASAEALPFPDGSFDLVISSLTMHHTKVPAALREFARVLRPGGRVAIADMGRNTRFDTFWGAGLKLLLAMFYLVSKRSWTMMRAELEAANQMYTPAAWAKMLAEAGLRPVRIEETPHPTTDWYSSTIIVEAGK